jgi:hypothetical protein
VDLAEGLALTIECDANARAAIATLTKLLGPPTAVVASGGEWMDPKTGELEPKLHGHWRLKVPARDADAFAKLKLARKLAAKIVDGDTSNVPIVHCIRWPGSVHRKADPRLCHVVAMNDEAEIDLDDVLTILKKAAGKDATNGGGAAASTEKNFFEKFGQTPASRLNDAAIANYAAWVPELFPNARPYHGTGFRVSSKDLGRDLEEDLSFAPEGIKDFGVHDIGDEREGKRTPIDVVMEWGQVDFGDACDWLRERLELPEEETAQESKTILPKGDDKKLPWIVELGSKLWGAAVVSGNEYRFGADQSKVIDPRKGMWFDFTTNKGGSLRDLMKKVEAANRKQSNVDDIVIVRASDIPMRVQDWIWEGHLVRGSQELMSGMPDLSKSTVQINYVACATARLVWPDGAPAIEPMNVVMLTAEDTLDQIVVPRLRAAGADINRVTFIKCIKTDEHDRQFLLAEDLYRLEHIVKKIGDVGLITIDPITAYMGGRMDSHKATEVRSQLGPLKDFAERMNIAISTITHPAKHAGQRALDHFIGSQAFIAACRVGHLCVAEMEEDENNDRVPTGRILFTNVRNTGYRQLMPTLAYRREEVVVERTGEGFLMREITAPRIAWEGSVDITAEAAVAAASGKAPDVQPKVQAFLRETLKDGKLVPQKEIADAAAAKGFTEKQLRTAKDKLGIHVDKEHGKMVGGWMWRLPTIGENEAAVEEAVKVAAQWVKGAEIAVKKVKTAKKKTKREKK